MLVLQAGGLDFSIYFRDMDMPVHMQLRIHTMEMTCYRTMLHRRYTDHVANEDIRQLIMRHIGQHEDIMSTVRTYTLRWHGHVTRCNCLIKLPPKAQWKGKEGEATRKGIVKTTSKSGHMPHLRVTVGSKDHRGGNRS